MKLLLDILKPTLTFSIYDEQCLTPPTESSSGVNWQDLNLFFDTQWNPEKYIFLLIFSGIWLLFRFLNIPLCASRAHQLLNPFYNSCHNYFKPNQSIKHLLTSQMLLKFKLLSNYWHFKQNALDSHALQRNILTYNKAMAWLKNSLIFVKNIFVFVIFIWSDLS